MSFPTRFLLASLAVLLFFVLLSVESRRHDDSSELRHHRHRHRHEILASRWSSPNSRKRLGSDQDDYEENYQNNDDYSEYADYEDSDEDDYATERRSSRVHTSKHNGNHHRYDARYGGSRYYHRGTHHIGTGRGYEVRGYAGHHRSSARTSGYRKRYKDEENSDEEADSYNDRPVTRRRYEDNDNSDEDVDNEPSGFYYNSHKPISRKRIPTHSSDVRESKGRRSRYEPRKDWHYKVDDEEDDYAYDADDEDEEEEEIERESRLGRKYTTKKSRFHQEELKSDRRSSGSTKFDEWVKKIKGIKNDSRSHDIPKKRNFYPATQEEEAEDELRLDDDEDEVDLWKDEEEDKELDNDFYKNEETITPPLKTYEDIIRRLTEDRTTTTPKPTIPAKRDYRNAEIESHLRRDAYGNLKFFDSNKNISSIQQRHKTSNGFAPRNLNLVDGTMKSRKDLTAAASKSSISTRKKSLEEYEEEEDNAKTEEDEEAGTQADSNTVSLSILLDRNKELDER